MEILIVPQNVTLFGKRVFIEDIKVSLNLNMEVALKGEIWI